MEKERRSRRKQAAEPVKLTRAEKVAMKKKQDREMYISFARELRGYDDDNPAVKDVKFTRSGAHVTFADGMIERIERADIPVEYQNIFVPVVKPKTKAIKRRPIAVQPALEPIPEADAEDQILAVQEGDKIITIEIDDEAEHTLLNMNPLSEVLTTIYEKPPVEVSTKSTVDIAGPSNPRDPRLVRQKHEENPARSTDPTAVDLSNAEKKRLDQQRSYIKQQQEELFKKQAKLDEEASMIEDRLLKRDEEIKQLMQAETVKRKREREPEPRSGTRLQLPKIPKIREPPLKVEEVYGEEEEEEVPVYGPGMKPTKIIAECVKAAVQEALQERERAHTLETKKTASELKRLRDLTERLQRDLSESRRDSRSSSRGSSAYEYQVSISESELDEQIDEKVDEIPPKKRSRRERVPKTRSDRDSAPLMERDVSKLEYKLERSKDFRYWFALFKMEMVLKKLVDVIDEHTPPCQAFSIQEMAERKTIVKGIILSHIDEVYSEQVLELDEPIKILEKLEHLKRCEVNETSFAIREKLHSLKYNIKSDNVFDFDLKFDKLIRQLETIKGVRQLDEVEKRDFYYRAVVGSVPSIRDATYSERANGTGDGFNFDQMRMYVRQFESENKPLLQGSHRGMMYLNRGRRQTRHFDPDRCYNCGDLGHFGRNCPDPPGTVKCYKCKGKGHLSYDCPSKRNLNTNRRENKFRRGSQTDIGNRFIRRGSGRPSSNNRPVGSKTNFRRDNPTGRNFRRDDGRNFGRDYDNRSRREYVNRNADRRDDYKKKNQNRGRQNKQYRAFKPKTAVGDKNKVKNNTTERDEKPQVILIKGSERKSPTAFYIGSDRNATTSRCYMLGNTRGKLDLNNNYISFIVDSGASEHMVNDRRVLSNFDAVDEKIRCANRAMKADLTIGGVGDIFFYTNADQPIVCKLANVSYSPDVAENLLSVRKFIDAGCVSYLTDQLLYIINPKTNQILLKAEYNAPNWILIVRLIDPNEVKGKKFVQTGKEFNHNLQRVILETGGAPPSVEITDTVSHEDETPQEDKELEEYDETHVVNPAITKESQGFDVPKLLPSLDAKLDENLVIDIDFNTLKIVRNKKKEGSEAEGMLWHRRLGHASFNYLLELQKREEKLRGVKFDEAAILRCDTCALAKMTCLPFKAPRTRAIKPLQIIHADLMGPIKPMAYRTKNRFIAVFIDDYSRLAMAYAMNSKDETGYYLEKFVNTARNILGEDAKMCTLRSDQGTAFMGGYTKEFLMREKAECIPGPPETPQHNGVAERFNRTLQMKLRALLFDSGLPQHFWELAMRAAVFLYNRTPHRSINFDIPMKKFAPHQSCHTEQFRRFGCLTYMKTPKRMNTRKGSPRAIRVFHVGYLASGYLLYDNNSDLFLESRNVRFNENVVYKDVVRRDQISSEDVFQCLEEDDEKNEQVDEESEMRKRRWENVPSDEFDGNKKRKMALEQGVEKRVTHSQTIKDNSFINLCSDENLRNGVLYLESGAEAHQIPGSQYDEIKYNALADINQDPLTFNQVVTSREKRQWLGAIEDELMSMRKNDVWIYVDRPNQNVIDSRWLFKKKPNKGGGDKYKARLVIRGFKDTNQYDLRETYAPVARLSTVRIVLAIINKFNLDAIQLNVKTAFLNGTIHEDIFMEIPDGLNMSENYRDKKVCKLQKALYGLRISPKRWNRKFTEEVSKLGLRSMRNEPCLFIWREKSKIAILLLYVDDVIVASNHSPKMQEIYKTLHSVFEMSDLGEPVLFLGMNIRRDREQHILELSQRDYILKILKRFEMSEAKPMSTPTVKKSEKDRNNKPINCEESEIMVPFREAIGSLLYLSGTTRPDITYAVNVLSRCQSTPTLEDWIAVKRVFRYLKGTLDEKLIYKGREESLILFTDASFSDLPGSKSTEGYVIKLYGDAVVWRSHKQGFVAMSTYEAEFLALSTGCMEVVATNSLLEFILDEKFTPIECRCDNSAAVACVKKENTIALRHNVERHKDYTIDCTEKGLVNVEWIDSDHQLADIFTKALPKKDFDPHFISLLGKCS